MCKLNKNDITNLLPIYVLNDMRNQIIASVSGKTRYRTVSKIKKMP